MPEKKKTERARRETAGKKAPTTKAGKFVREEMEAMKEGEGAESRQQAIAIGLSRARRAGVKVPAPRKGNASSSTRRKAAKDIRKGKKAPVKARKAPAKGRS